MLDRCGAVRVQLWHEGPRGAQATEIRRLGAGEVERRAPPVPAPDQARAGHRLREDERHDPARDPGEHFPAGRLGRLSEVIMKRYAVVVEDAGTNLAAYVPDLPGCVATAATRAELER